MVPLPIVASYSLIVIGVLTIVGVAYKYSTDLRKWQAADQNPNIFYLRLDEGGILVKQNEERAPGAFIDFSMPNYTMHNSNNVSAVTDVGRGKFTISFGKELPEHYAIVPIGATPRDFSVLAANSTGATIEFGGDEPGRVAMKFDPA
jgi:hypothetical protein